MYFSKFETLNMFVIILAMTIIFYLIAYIIHMLLSILRKFSANKKILSTPNKNTNFGVGDIVKLKFYTKDVTLCIDDEGIITANGVIMKINDDKTCNIEWRQLVNDKYPYICSWDRWGNNYDFVSQYFGYAYKNPNVKYNKTLKSVNVPIDSLELIKKNNLANLKIGDNVELEYYTSEIALCGDGHVQRKILVTASICEILDNNKIKIKINKLLNTEPYDIRNFAQCNWNRKNNTQNKNSDDDSFDYDFMGNCGVNPISLPNFETIVDKNKVRIAY